MKQNFFTTLSFILITLATFSQTRTYDEIALLFAQENIKGTARYTAMSGAFGALGGNLSAGNINPAGLAFFNSSEISITLDKRSTLINSTFYNSSTGYENDKLSFSQGGGVIVFNTDSDYWNKFALGINITNVNDFDNSYVIKGNSQFSNEVYFHEIQQGATLYDTVDSQKMSNFTYGSNSNVAFTVAAKYNKYVTFGGSLISYSIDYNQDINILEKSSDLNDNTLSAKTYQNLNTYGGGIGFNFGIIIKPIKNVRVGLSHQTPIWYTLTEDFTEILDLNLSDDVNALPYGDDQRTFDYKLKTPSKTTASLAFILGKQGLISMDYMYKDYSKTKLGPTTDFEGANGNENELLATDLTGVSQIRIGGEFRLKKLSLRAGYHIEDSPYKDTVDTDVIKGYSFGLGFKIFRRSKLDFSYSNDSSTDRYYYINSPNSAKLNTTNDRITATFTMKL